jgi:hypothetical protein
MARMNACAMDSAELPIDSMKGLWKDILKGAEREFGAKTTECRQKQSPCGSTDN